MGVAQLHAQWCVALAPRRAASYQRQMPSINPATGTALATQGTPSNDLLASSPPDMEGEPWHTYQREHPHFSDDSGTKFNAQARKVFLRTYALTQRKTHAAAAVGITDAHVQQWLKYNRAFAVQFQAAHNEYRDQVAAEVRRRSILGVDTPVFHNGEQVGVVRKYSDKLLELEAKRVDTDYRERAAVISKTINHNNTTNTQINAEQVSVGIASLSREERAQLRALAQKMLPAK